MTCAEHIAEMIVNLAVRVAELEVERDCYRAALQTIHGYHGYEGAYLDIVTERAWEALHPPDAS